VADHPFHVAIDLGAGSGRTFVGRVDDEAAFLEEVHRFRYPPRRMNGHLRWDVTRLFEGLRVGLRQAGRAVETRGGALESIGVDSWGVDYGLVGADGALIEEPISYRDERTRGVLDDIFARVRREVIFARTGVQFLEINTLCQLVAHVRDGLPSGAERLLMMADLCHHYLCGSTSGEYTNASTTQLLNAETRRWDEGLFQRLGLPYSLMPPLVKAGAHLGDLTPELQRECGVGPLRIVAPATHDTASAVAGTPLQEGWAFISSGTWSLVGVERDRPLVNEEAARANFTNEGGAFGTIRFLKNVMGMWVLECCRREWEAAGIGLDLPSLVTRVQAFDRFPGFVNLDHPRFFNPPSMNQELRASLEARRQGVADDPVSLTKVILDSMALRYRSVIATLEQLTGQPVPGVHIVGGGSLNAYLNQATANACNRPVQAGPVEATAAGNVLAQAIGAGELPSLADGRDRLARGTRLERYLPRNTHRWAEAARRYAEVEAQG
jgi:rhamnulokinase